MSSTILAEAEAENKEAVYETDLVSGEHFFIADEPLEFGGQDMGPSPGSLLCASLASCKAITLRMYANRKGWKVDSIKVKVSLIKSDEDGSAISSFSCQLAVTGDVSEEQKQRMLQIAEACPVQKLLSRSAEIKTSMTEIEIL